MTRGYNPRLDFVCNAEVLAEEGRRNLISTMIWFGIDRIYRFRPTIYSLDIQHRPINKGLNAIIQFACVIGSEALQYPFEVLFFAHDLQLTLLRRQP